MRQTEPLPPVPDGDSRAVDVRADGGSLDLDQVESVVLRRLIAEVRRDATVVRSYDRVYNRHNR